MTGAWWVLLCACVFGLGVLSRRAWLRWRSKRSLRFIGVDYSTAPDDTRVLVLHKRGGASGKALARQVGKPRFPKGEIVHEDGTVIVPPDADWSDVVADCEADPDYKPTPSPQDYDRKYCAPPPPPKGQGARIAGCVGRLGREKLDWSKIELPKGGTAAVLPRCRCEECGGIPKPPKPPPDKFVKEGEDPRPLPIPTKGETLTM